MNGFRKGCLKLFCCCRQKRIHKSISHSSINEELDQSIQSESIESQNIINSEKILIEEKPIIYDRIEVQIDNCLEDKHLLDRVLEMRSSRSTQEIIEFLVSVMEKPLKELNINYLKEEILPLIQQIPELFGESDEIFVFVSNQSLDNRHIGYDDIDIDLDKKFIALKHYLVFFWLRFWIRFRKEKYSRRLLIEYFYAFINAFDISETIIPKKLIIEELKLIEMARNEAKNYKYIVELVVTNITDAQNNRIDISEEEILIRICGIESFAQIGQSLHFSIEAKALADNWLFEINFNYKNESNLHLTHFRRFSARDPQMVRPTVYSIRVNGITELYVWIDIKYSNDWISFCENINLIDSQLLAYYYSKALNSLTFEIIEIVHDFDLKQHLFQLFMLLAQNCDFNVRKLMIQSLTDIYFHISDENSLRELIALYRHIWKTNDESRKINFLDNFLTFRSFLVETNTPSESEESLLLKALKELPQILLENNFNNYWKLLLLKHLEEIRIDLTPNQIIQYLSPIVVQLLKSEDKEFFIVWIKSLNQGIEENSVFLSDIDFTEEQESHESDSEYSKVSDCHQVWSF
jgi:hypothetical protein